MVGLGILSLIWIIPLFVAATVELFDSVLTVKIYLFATVRVLNLSLTISDVLKLGKPDLTLMPVFKAVTIRCVDIDKMVSLYNPNNVIVSLLTETVIGTVKTLGRTKINYNVRYGANNYLSVYALLSVSLVRLTVLLIKRRINARTTNTRNS